MYNPTSFHAKDPELTQRLIRENAFATLIATRPDGSLEITHAPLVLLDDGATLLGHLARANPMSKLIQAGVPVTAVFIGAHGYVSPRWYRDGLNVPTWNYAVAHVRGKPRARLTADDARDGLDRLSRAFEGPDGWRLAGLPDDFREDLTRAILAFDLPMESIEAKYKLSQNRELEDAEGVMQALAREPGDAARDLLRWMELVRG